jgi:ubiquinone/menaquinone biosynthesis C-methylase UbiE
LTNNYNYIARCYDLLSRTVYGNAIANAQKDLIEQIKPNSSILIVGGGTGWILEELTEIYDEGLEIEYVEMSKEMIALSEKRNTGQNKISFVCKSIEEYFPDKKFDYILTAFFFDNFQKEKIKIIFSKLNAVLKYNGYWLYADFFYDNKKGKLWQKIFLKTMYTFFRITCKIETTTLTDMQPIFHKYGYIARFSSAYYAGFIRSEVYEKTVWIA